LSGVRVAECGGDVGDVAASIGQILPGMRVEVAGVIVRRVLAGMRSWLPQCVDSLAGDDQLAAIAG
jgi:hypothetical protein